MHDDFALLFLSLVFGCLHVFVFLEPKRDRAEKWGAALLLGGLVYGYCKLHGILP